jgi:hypothetical protein
MSLCGRERGWAESTHESSHFHQHSWTATPRLDGEGVLRYDMTAHTSSVRLRRRRLAEGALMQQEGGNAAPTRCPQFTDSLDGGTTHRAEWSRGRVVSWTDRSWKKRTHAVLRHVEGHEGKPDQCRLLFCSLPQTDSLHGRELLARAWVGLGRSA